MAFLQRVRVPIGNDPSSSRVWFVRRYRDITTDADVLYLKFPRAGGSRGELLVPPSLLGQPNDFVRRLVDKGALWPSEHERRIEILRQIANSLPDEVGTILGRGGWHGHVFQLGQKTIGAPQKRFILRPELAPKATQLVHQAGSLKDWQNKVAAPAALSSYAAFAIMHALAAPLFRFDPDLPEGAIFHLGGAGGSGKTTALIAGASVAGSLPLTDWSATDRALHERAAIANGLQMILDDTERLSAVSSPLVRLARIAHTLTSGQSQDYAAPVQNTLPPLRWDCWAISSGPTAIEEQFAQAGGSRSDGDRPRWIDINLPARECGGIWDHVKNDTPRRYARRSEALADAARNFHGIAASRWISIVQANQERFRERVPARINMFLDRHCPNAGDVERRSGRKFGLVYAAGVLACANGILPWNATLPITVCGELFGVAMASHRARSTAFADLFTRLKSALQELPFIEERVPNFATASIQGYRATHAGIGMIPHSPSKSLILLSGSQYFRYKSWC